MKKIFFPLSIFFLLSTVSFAQQSKIDSLKILLTNKNSQSQSEVLFQIADAYLNINKDSSMIYLKNILKSQNKEAVAKANRYLGHIYLENGNFSEALKNYLSALNYYEVKSDKIHIANIYDRIGEVWRFQNDLEKSLSYHQPALSIYTELNDSFGLANSLNDIALVYEAKKEFETALSYHEKSLALKKNLGDKRMLGDTYCNIGTIYRALGKYEKALEYQYITLKIDEELGDEVNIAIIHNNIAALLILMGNINDAFLHLSKAEKLAKSHNALDPLKYTYLQFTRLFEKKNDYKQAYQFHIQYAALKDTLFNEESSKQITEMQTKYETEKKEQQIKLLNKDKEIQTKDLERQKTIRNAVAGGLILVLLFSFVLINRFLLIKKQKKIIEVEREKSEKLLLNILPKDTADELKRNNAVTPKRYDQVTVMFTDFKGFTTIAEKMTAEELVSELDFIFKKFDEIISKYPIEKIKTIGDAYMCAGGLPTLNSTNPMDVVLAALEIQEFMERLAVGNLQLANEGKKLQIVNWKLRIGIHTGSVIAGVVGDKKFAYDIWGDTVNTASRMESSGEAGKVNISGITYGLLVGTRHAVSLRFTFRGKIPAKNKGEIEMYFVEKK